MAKIHVFPGIDTDEHPQYMSDHTLMAMLDLRAHNIVDIKQELEEIQAALELESRLFVLLRDEYSRRDLPWPPVR